MFGENTFEYSMLVIIFLLLASMVIGVIHEYIKEKKRWNKGYCKECGEKLEPSDTYGKSGTRFYKCKNKHIIWLEWYKGDIKK